MGDNWNFIFYVAAAYIVFYFVLCLVVQARAKNYVQRDRKISVGWNSRIPDWFGTYMVTVFGIIWVAGNSMNAKELAHEWYHTQQERRCMYFLYPIAIGVSFLLGRGHDNSPMEKAAYKYAEVKWGFFDELKND